MLSNDKFNYYLILPLFFSISSIFEPPSPRLVLAELGDYLIRISFSSLLFLALSLKLNFFNVHLLVILPLIHEYRLTAWMPLVTGVGRPASNSYEVLRMGRLRRRRRMRWWTRAWALISVDFSAFDLIRFAILGFEVGDFRAIFDFDGALKYRILWEIISISGNLIEIDGFIRQIMTLDNQY